MACLRAEPFSWQALNLFVGPGVPASRLAGDPDGIYVSQSIVGSKDMSSLPRGGGGHFEGCTDLLHSEMQKCVATGARHARYRIR